MNSTVSKNNDVVGSLNASIRSTNRGAAGVAETFKETTTELKKSLDNLAASIGGGANFGGGNGGPTAAGAPLQGPTPGGSTLDEAVNPLAEKFTFLGGVVEKLEAVFVMTLDRFVSEVKSQTVQFANISDRLLSVGFSFDQFRDVYALNNKNFLDASEDTNQRMLTLAGSVQDAARNTASLVDIGISPLSKDILNLAGRMGVLGLDVGKLMSVNQKLFTQGGLNSQELNGLAATLERATIDQSVNTENLIMAIDRLSDALPALNLAGLTEEASQLTLELTKALPAGMKSQAGAFVAALTTTEGAIKGAQFGITDVFQSIQELGAKGAARRLVQEIDSAGRYVEQLGQGVNNSVLGIAATGDVVGSLGQMALQLKQGFGKADESGAQKQIEGLNEGFQNLKTEFMKPISEGIASFAEGFITQIPLIIDFIKENGEVLAELTTKALGFFQQMVFGILEYLPTIVRTIGAISGALLPFIAAKIIDTTGIAIKSGITKSNALLTQLVIQSRANSVKQAASGAAGGLAGMAGFAGRALGLLTGPVGMIALSIGGGLLGEALASKVSAPLEDISSKIGKLDITQERQLQVAEQESVQRRLDAQRTYQREQASEFDTFLKNFMARNIDEMAMSRNAQNTVMGILVDRVEELTEVTRGTGRQMGEVVEAGRAADALRTEVEPQ